MLEFLFLVTGYVASIPLEFNIHISDGKERTWLHNIMRFLLLLTVYLKNFSSNSSYRNETGCS